MRNAPDTEEPLHYVIRIHERAARDINEITVWLAEEVSDGISLIWRRGIHEIIAGLSQFPRRCPRAPEGFQREIRQLLYRRQNSRMDIEYFIPL